MRLFVALDFSPNEKSMILKNAEICKKSGVVGNYSRVENLHITLAFLGEVEKSRLGIVKNALNSVVNSPVEIQLGNFECFGDILVIRVENSDNLISLADGVRNELKKNGIAFDSKPFRAHITLAREVKFPNGKKNDLLSQKVSPLRSVKNEIVLFESTRIDGKLIYRKLHAKKLN